MSACVPECGNQGRHAREAGCMAPRCEGCHGCPDCQEAKREYAARFEPKKGRVRMASPKADAKRRAARKAQKAARRKSR